MVMRPLQPDRLIAVSGPSDFVWYGVRGFARLGGVGGGGLVGRSQDTLEILSFQRTSAEAIFTTSTGSQVKVASHRTQTGEAFDWLRDTAVSNALNWVPVEDRRGVVRNLDQPGPPTVDGVPWEPGELTVDGTAQPFEVCRFDNGHGVAVGRIPPADVVVESRGVPPEAVELEGMPNPPPDRPRQS
jgi:hypothetical protein